MDRAIRPMVGCKARLAALPSRKTTNGEKQQLQASINRSTRRHASPNAKYTSPSNGSATSWLHGDLAITKSGVALAETASTCDLHVSRWITRLHLIRQQTAARIRKISVPEDEAGGWYSSTLLLQGYRREVFRGALTTAGKQPNAILKQHAKHRQRKHHSTTEHSRAFPSLT